jgi:hypothetical protein
MLGIASRTVASRARVALRVVRFDGTRLLVVTLEAFIRENISHNGARGKRCDMAKARKGERGGARSKGHNANRVTHHGGFV